MTVPRLSVKAPDSEPAFVMSTVPSGRGRRGACRRCWPGSASPCLELVDRKRAGGERGVGVGRGGGEVGAGGGRDADGDQHRRERRERAPRAGDENGQTGHRGTLLGEGVADDLAASAQSSTSSIEVAAGNRAISQAARPLALRPRLTTGLPWSAVPSSAGGTNGLNTPWTDVRVRSLTTAATDGVLGCRGHERRAARSPSPPTQKCTASPTPTPPASPGTSARRGRSGACCCSTAAGSTRA